MSPTLDHFQIDTPGATAVNDKAELVLSKLKRGQALLQLGRTGEARDEVECPVQLMPDLAEANRLMGQLCRSLHLYEEAAIAFERLVANEPNDAAAWLGYAEVLALSYSRFEEGPRVFDKAAMVGADDPDFLLTLAERNLMNGRFGEAEALLDRVFTMCPKAQNQPLANIWLARAMEAQGKHENARKAYEAALAQYRHNTSNSQNAEAVINATLFASVLFQLGDVDQAEQVIENFCTPELLPEAFRYDHGAYLIHARKAESALRRANTIVPVGSLAARISACGQTRILLH